MKVFITGASSGIGAALALEYAQRYPSITLGLLGRREEALTTLQSKLSQLSNASTYLYIADVRNPQAMQAAAQDFMSVAGAPNVVIASAGVSSSSYTDQPADLETFHAVFNINVLGMLHTFQPFVQAMKQLAADQQTAQLVGIASVAGVRGLPGAGAYSASKSAVIKYLESLRVEMAQQRVVVTTIAPGYIKTPMTDVNTYPMPFLMPADKAAAKFVDAIEKQKSFVIIPWQMGWVSRFMRLLPNCLWDWLMKRAPHKPNVSID